jgi:NAD(P)-dependent dehydrogenase (short-subunit alcohol dehydrogenase family)
LTIHSSSGRRSAANLRVLITGAGAGIGYACARAFSAQGADLILSDIDAPSLKRAAINFDALGRFCDVASEASVAVFTAEVLRSFPSLDVLINAAGRSYVRNLGTLRITRAFLPMMKKDGNKKHIVNIAPMGGTVRDSCYFPYAASQEAFDRLSEALAENVRGTKVALTTIVPSIQQTASDGTLANAIATIHPSYPRDFHDIDHDQVAAAVVEAVRSRSARPGHTTVLTAHAVSNGPRRPLAHLPDPIAQKLG